MTHRPPVSQTTRDYATERCAMCRHDRWQNDAVGDCQVLHIDVQHHSVAPCNHFERLTDA
jgi:hypothetical protein